MKRWKKRGVRSAALCVLTVLLAGGFGLAGSTAYGAPADGQLRGQGQVIEQAVGQGQVIEQAAGQGQVIAQAAGQGQETESGADRALQDMGLQDEMEGLQQFLDDVMGQQDGGMEGLSFWGLMKELMKGNLKGILGQTGMGLKNALFSQVDKLSLIHI